jgi:bifunctional oligoribonuclease and PAP phosphatase NrnA
MTEIQQIKALLSSPKDIVIISHRNPDGDAIGSSLALSFFLKSMMHSVSVILPSECPPTFEYLDGIKDILIFDLKPIEVRSAIDRAKVIFYLDFNGLDRIDKVGELLSQTKADTIMIDHHIDPEPIADFILSDVTASSTSEMIYKFIDDLGYRHKLNQKIGSCILTGIITDTGSFKYNTRKYTYTVAGELKDLGVDDYGIQNLIFNNQKEKYLRLLGHCLANRMQVDIEHGAALIYLDKNDYKTFEISRGDTEGIVNYLLMIKGVNVAAFITEQPSIIKISLRSKDHIDVQQIAAKYFNGGGHKNASGGSAYAKLEEIIAKWWSIVPSIPK